MFEVVMFEIVITCQACGAVHSISGLAQEEILSDAEVLEKAKHSPICSIKRAGSGKVLQQPQRDDEPFVSFYSIEELSYYATVF